MAQAFWFILPAYVANGVPLILGGGTPVDFGKKLSDGNRILGDGKTIRGSITGLLAGVSFGIFQVFLISHPEFPAKVVTPRWGLKIVLLLVLGALFGDLAASFLKRRMGLQRGHSVLVVDQLDFIVGSLILASVVWLPPLRIIIVIVVATPIIHLIGNFLAYEIGLKTEPY